jgi:hypothetical protein
MIVAQSVLDGDGRAVRELGELVRALRERHACRVSVLRIPTRAELTLSDPEYEQLALRQELAVDRQLDFDLNQPTGRGQLTDRFHAVRVGLPLIVSDDPVVATGKGTRADRGGCVEAADGRQADVADEDLARESVFRSAFSHHGV